jgi:hypothetical protein
MPSKKPDQVLEIASLTYESLEIGIVGTTPMICNRLSEKVRQELLYPGGVRRSPAARAAALKYDVFSEFRGSPYRAPANAPTALAVLASSFKAAIERLRRTCPARARRKSAVY